VAVYAPSRIDPVVGSASAVIGGPAGRRLASASGFWRAVTVLVLLSCAMLGLGVVQKEHCRTVGWSSPDQFWHACYTDIPVLFASDALGGAKGGRQGATAGSGRPDLAAALGANGLGEPPLAGTLMWVTGAFVPGADVASERQYFDLSAVLLAVLLAIAVAAASITLGRRGWDAGHLALSPVLLVSGLISYELLAVALTALALLALARGRPLVGGLLFGLAIGSAPQVAIVVLAVVLMARRLRPTSAAVAFTAGTVVTWLAVRVLLLPGLSGGLKAAFTSWHRASPGYGSVWLLPSLLEDSSPDPATSAGGRVLQGVFGWVFKLGALGGATSAVLCLVTLAVLAGLILYFTIGWERRAGVTDELPDGARYGSPVAAVIPARVAPLALALLAAVLLTDKSLPIQASLLMLPLIALSGLPWRDHLIWAATEIVYFVAVWLYIAGETPPARGLPSTFYLLLLLARLAGIALIGVRGVLAYRQISAQPHPEGRLREHWSDVTPTPAG
jgi:hypothetical protein